MKRLLLLLSLFVICVATGFGQVGKTKQTTRLPLDSAAMQSAKRRDVQVIDGSQNVQTRSGAQAANPYASRGGQQLTLPKVPVPTDKKKLEEPKFVFVERERKPSQLRSSIVRTHKEAAYAFFKETPKLKISRPESQIRIDTIMTDPLNMAHVKGKQLFRDTPIYGMNFTFHISSKNERFLGYTVDSTHINMNEAQYDADDAIRIAMRDLSRTTKIQTLSEQMKQSLNYEQPTAEAIYYPTGLNIYNYTYKVVIRPNYRDEWIYFIDAHSGEVVDKYNNTPTDGPNTGSGRDLSGVTRTVNTYLENGTHYMVNTTKSMFKESDFSGIIGVYDAKNSMDFHDTGTAYFAANTSTTWNNPTAISAMHYTTMVYDYLLKTFNRNSFDDKKSSMQVIINVCDDEDGGGYENAFWNGAIVALGNGREVFHSFAGGLDIIAHEFGHAVISKTTNLEYKNQSGAINEAYADIFGVMVDRSNWTVGEAVIKDKGYFPTGFMRDMRNPHNGGSSLEHACWQPATVSEMYLGNEDNGGVHINNSIPAHTFYLYATATSKERAEQVYFRALTTYLTPTSKFINLRKGIIQAAKDLGYSNDVKTIENAFDKVGILDDTVENQPPPTPPTPPDLSTNPGQWGMLIVNTDPSDRNTIYKTSDYRSITPVSTTKLCTTPNMSTPSVTDDGKKTVFVDSDNNIRLLDMSTGKEEILNGEGDNQNVTISRDGKRIAVVTTYDVPEIWVYDIGSDKWKSFKLYNPTTGSGGAKSGGPRFADAIEFDHTGEYLLYDAYNVAGSSLGGNSVDYWDIGLINVWDNSRNNWGTGEVTKMFSDLSAGVEVFNPVFSKNSPFIIAFDIRDEEEDLNAVFGVNLATGNVDIIHVNYLASYPSYSMDDKRMSFNTYDFDEDDYGVAYKDLGSDKISPKVDYFDEQIFVIGGMFPVYYGTGTRVLGTKPVASFTSDARSGSNPLNVQYVDMSEGNPSSWRWTFQGGSPSSSTQQNPKVTYTAAGTYPVSLVATNSYGSHEVVRQSYITIGTTGTELIAQEKMKVYPNPASDYVWVDTRDKAQQVKMFNLMGQTFPVTFTDEQGKICIKVSDLPAGLYILQVTLTNGDIATQKIVKR
jgi:Zinc metalloprotease (elastase)